MKKLAVILLTLTLVFGAATFALAHEGWIGDNMYKVLMDIKPGSWPNAINVNKQGVVPVAILTTATFDASTVDPSTVFLRTHKATALKSALEDVDGDGDIDLIVHFDTPAIKIPPGTTYLILNAKTYSGVIIVARDEIVTVPKLK